VVFLVVNAWFLGRIANTLDQRRLSSVCPTDNKDPEVGVFRSKFRGFSKTFEPVLDRGEHECSWVCRIKGIRTVQDGFVYKSRDYYYRALVFIPRRADLG